MWATNSSSDLASTCGAQKGDAPRRIGTLSHARAQFARILLTASTVASDVWALAEEKVSPIVVQAEEITSRSFEGVQQRCSKVVKFSKSAFATATQEATSKTNSAKSKITDRLAHTRSKVLNAAHSGQELALHCIPTSVKTRVTQTWRSFVTRSSYVLDSIANLVQSSRDKLSDTAASTKAAATKLVDTSKAMVADLAGRATDAVRVSLLTPLKTRMAAASSWASSHGAAARQTLLSVTEDARAKAHLAADASRAEVSKLKAAMKEVASDKRAPVAAAAAAGGAVAGGSTGATVGVVSGTVLGAAVGLVPAVFTFGLSIPIGAVLGGGAGACVGTVAGSTIGGVAGGAVGWKKDDIRQGASTAKETATASAITVFTKAGDCTQYVKQTATASKEYAQKQASVTTDYLRERVQRLGTKAGDCTEYVKETAAASKEYAQKQATVSTNYVREQAQRLGATGGTEALCTESD